MIGFAINIIVKSICIKLILNFIFIEFYFIFVPS